jgi:hypothetical protein
MKVWVNIDSIMLKNSYNNNSKGFTLELQQELSKLIKEKGINGIPIRGILNIETLDVVYDTTIEPMGEQVARSIYRSLKKNGL